MVEKNCILGHLRFNLSESVRNNNKNEDKKSSARLENETVSVCPTPDNIMSDWAKSQKNQTNKNIEKMSDDASKFLGGILGDISSRSAYAQIGIGAATGWATGFATMKVGKFAAFAIGGGIILMEIAHQEGFIEVDWSKISRKLDKVTDKVEEAVTGQEKSWMDKAERSLDRKLDRAEELLKNKTKKAKKWYSSLIGDENGPKINDLHIFLTAFIGGVALGIASS